MVFSSNIFLFLFLPIVLVIYYLLNEKYRNIFLTLSSLVFYFVGERKFVVIIIASIILNYLFGIIIERINREGTRRIILWAAVLLNLAILFYFKYMGFFAEVFSDFSGMKLTVKAVALPIGISFFTFQGLSYVIDLYWGNVKVQKNPVKLGLYISLFPQLIAGPIVRYKDVAEQIDHRKETIDKFAEGIYRFSIGMAKKVILANGVGIVADEIFGASYSSHLTGTAWLGIICYTLQIYFDFGGYSDMAIGLGKMFGFDFLENFDFPYLSTSVREFWRRWHISLSSFFRDYVYIPLGGSRKGNVYLHLFIVFLLTGLWHGASWNFVIWGIWHGIFIIGERLMADSGLRKLNIPDIVKRILTLLIVMIGWVAFRADDLHYAVGFIGRMFGLVGTSNVVYQTGYYIDPYRIFITIVATVAAFGGFRMIMCKISDKGTGIYIAVRNLISFFLLLISAVYVMNATYNPFIYFRF